MKKKFLGGRQFNQFAELGPAASLWLETVANVREHGETQGRPVDRLPEERAALLPLNPVASPEVRTLSVRASRRCRVSIETNRYSVPTKFAGALLTAQIEGAQVRFFAERTLVAEHARSFNDKPAAPRWKTPSTCANSKSANGRERGSACGYGFWN